MSSFLAQCPHCLTSFRVTESQLDAAEGLVRCGACLGIFSAASNRITLKMTPEEAAAAGLQEPDEESDADEEFEELAPAAEQNEERSDEAEPVADQTEEEEQEETVEAEVEEISAPTQPYDAPPLLAAEPDEPAPRWTAAATPDLLDSSDLLGEDFDIPLGDFNLDSDEEPEDDAEEYEDAFAEDDEEYEDEDEFEDEDETDEEEFEDEDETDEDDFENEDETDEEEFEDEEDEFLAEADEALAATEEDDDELPPPVVQRAPVERITTDKSALRQRLAALDDDALEPLDDAALSAFDEPVTLVAAPRRSWLVGIALFIAIVLLAGALTLQYAYANLDTLSRNARFTPVLPYICRVLDCPAQERSQLASLVYEQLIVRSHPRYAQALEVSFIFRNDASEAQPFPAIELGFHDTGKRLLANRLFKPAEYLPNELQTSEMPPQQSLQITLEMVDPGSEAVNYTLAFRKP